MKAKHSTGRCFNRYFTQIYSDVNNTTCALANPNFINADCTLVGARNMASTPPDLSDDLSGLAMGLI